MFKTKFVQDSKNKWKKITLQFEFKKKEFYSEFLHFSIASFEQQFQANDFKQPSRFQQEWQHVSTTLLKYAKCCARYDIEMKPNCLHNFYRDLPSLYFS